MLNLVTNHLRSRDFQVIEASDGDTALELAQKHRPTLVVLDVMMPGMSGWEVCKRIKADKENEGKTAVIMLTGIGESLNDMTSPLFKADGWLDKPFGLDQLDAKVDEVLTTLDVARGEAAAKQPAAKKAAAKKAVAKKPAAKKPAAKKAGEEGGCEEAGGEEGGGEEEACGEEGARVEEARVEEARVEEARVEEARVEEARGEEACGEEACGEEARGEEACGEEACGEEACGEEEGVEEAGGEEEGLEVAARPPETSDVECRDAPPRKSHELPAFPWRRRS